jgi:transposase
MRDERQPELRQSAWSQPNPKVTMHTSVNRPDAKTPIRVDLGAIFLSLELSQSKWLVTSLSPGGGDKMSKYVVAAGNIDGLFSRFAELQRKALVREGQEFPLIVLQEAGLDGFWIHRLLQNKGIESHVVDPASVAVSRRHRRAKTDRIDGEALVRTLLAYKRGEPRVCAMVRAPTPAEEDRRRIARERKVLVNERVAHVNRIKGLLFNQGAGEYNPLRRDRRDRLEELHTGDGRPLPRHLKAQIIRELDRIEMVLAQIQDVERTQTDVIAADKLTAPGSSLLLGLKGIGPESAAVLWGEGLSRRFDNRRQVAAYAGLAPTPWQSGQVNHDQGVAKSGNPRLRTTLIQIAWLWLRHQPDSALTLWFKERVSQDGGRFKKSTIVALARKLLVALWKYTNAGVIIEGAAFKDA